MSVTFTRYVSSGFGDETNNPSFTGIQVAVGDWVIPSWNYRKSYADTVIGSLAMTGVTFSKNWTLENPIGTPEHRLQVFAGRATQAGTFNLTAVNTQYQHTAGIVTVVSGADATDPFATAVTQIWGSGSFSNPSLTPAGGQTDDLVFELLASGGWGNFNDFNPSDVTWNAQNSQTIIANQHSTVTGGATPRLIAAHKAYNGAGSNTVGFAPASGTEIYMHFAVAIKAAAPVTAKPAQYYAQQRRSR